MWYMIISIFYLYQYVVDHDISLPTPPPTPKLHNNIQATTLTLICQFAVDSMA